MEEFVAEGPLFRSVETAQGEAERLSLITRFKLESDDAAANFDLSCLAVRGLDAAVPQRGQVDETEYFAAAAVSRVSGVGSLRKN